MPHAHGFLSDHFCVSLAASTLTQCIFPLNRNRERLKKNIRAYKPLRKDVPKPRILLIGQISAGKSTFFNSINAVFRGYPIHQAESGFEGKSLSKKYMSYPISDGRGGPELPFILCDTMGLERSDGEGGIHTEDILSVIKGHVHHRYTVSPTRRTDPHYRTKPTLADKVHCVVYVIDASSPHELNPSVLKKLNDIRLKVNGLVMEMKNYSSELELSDAINILLLGALQQMLRAADSYFDNLNLNERGQITG
uniref:G domain-containing protein n=1 Tax=Erpetoichthys calabaricus TaxID=27687 RepID=A0A8C4T4Z8_ERPCA